ncbi:unnamed protein product [Discula destructiva]
MAEPTPPKSPTQGENTIHSSIHEEMSGEDGGVQSGSQPPEPEVPVCMFVQPCTTGSTLRKAISHIFGRNKLCTKSIPGHIWVHYCRKHYQRTRYRNVHEYALLQVDLVLQQINKVQAWSDDNVKYNRRGNGELRHWTLQARKREAKRLQDTESRKRRYVEEEEDDEDGASGTAIPIWLQPALNQNYATPRMLEIVEDIKEHMTAGDITQIPDIEVLPEIITDGNESRPKPVSRRTSSVGGHRHTKSEIYQAPMGSYNGARFGSMDATKRMRSGVSPFNYSMSNLAHRPAPVMNMSQSYTYGMRADNGFAAIAEAQADHGYWNGNTGYGSNSVLPQPVPQLPQRNQESVNIQQSFAPQGRPAMHARSMSEAPVMRNNGYTPNEFRFPAQVPSYAGQQQQPPDMYSNMNMGPQSQYGYQPPMPQGGSYGMTPRPDSQDGGYNNFYQQQQEWAVSRGHHARVQSTSAIHQSSIPGGPPAMPSVSGPQGLPSMHHMGGYPQQMYTAGQQGYGDYQPGRY